MKTILVLSLILTSLGIKNDSKITITPDKKVYVQGELITFKVKANKRFQLATNGDCGSSILPPSYIKETNGKFPEPYMGGQMCCGLPCMGSFKKYEFTRIDTLAIGRWKAVLFTCGIGAVESSIFEIRK